MDVKTWTTISRLLDDALNLPASACPAWIETLGAEHEALKPQLRARLARADVLGREAFLATLPKFESAPLDDAVAGASRVSALVGPHRLLASPEQVAQQPLGVLLFELLTGALPYGPGRDSAAALEEAIRAQVLRRANQAAPPALQKVLAGDLDTILAKALKKAPGARYPTAEASGDDCGPTRKSAPGVMPRARARLATLSPSPNGPAARRASCCRR